MTHGPKDKKPKVYLDHGKKEGDEMFGSILFNQSQLLADLLEILGLAPGQHLLWNPDPEGEHNEHHQQHKD